MSLSQSSQTGKCWKDQSEQNSAIPGVQCNWGKVILQIATPEKKNLNKPTPPCHCAVSGVSLIFLVEGHR